MSFADQLAFIREIPPFDRLGENELERAAGALDIQYFEEDAVLAEPGATAEHLFLVIKGLIQEQEDDEPVSVSGPQETAGAESLFKGEFERRLIAREELIAYQLPRHVFLDLCRGNRAFQDYFFEDISAKLHSLLERERGAELASFLMARIDEAYLNPPLFVEADATIHEAAKAMDAEGATSVLVKDDEGVGIASITGIHRALALERRSVDSPIRDIAHFDLISLGRDRSLFDAMLAMMRHGVSRIIVTEENASICGVLEQRSLMSFFATHSHLVVMEIRQASSVDDLARASERMVAMVQTLFAKGVKAHYIQHLVTELNSRIFHRLFELVAPAEVVENTCLVVMGSEGREEQILRTDQDNALIVRDGVEVPDLEAVTERFSAGLRRIGYPPCPGGYMVSNPRWRRSLAEYKADIFDWIHHPDQQGLLDLAVLADARAVAGDEKLLETLRGYLSSRFTDSPALLSNFARPILSFDTPLGLFTDFKVEKEEHPDELDIKKGGIFPVVHGARSLALEYRIEATSTIERLEALVDHGIFDRPFADDLIEALDFMNGLRLGTMLDAMAAGRKPDNYITPRRLNHLERDLLKDAFRLVNRFKKLIGYHFRLHTVT